MALILVVERDPRYISRIQEALASGGFRVHVVGGRAEALQAAASEAPDLVLASAEAPGAEALAVTFARRSGGPGVLALMPESLDGADAAAIEADEFLLKPFTDGDLMASVERALAARREVPRARPSDVTEHKLTSQDIFGDMLAEVEGDLGARPSRPPATQVEPPATLPPLRPATPTMGRSEVERKLEQTLSGVLGAPPAPPRPKPAVPVAPTPAAAPTRRAEPPAADVEALLSKTLSSLQIGAKPAATARPAPPPTAQASPPAAPIAPTAAAPTMPIPRPVAPTPTAAPVAPITATPPPAKPNEGTGVRSRADLGLAALEQLARSTPASAPTRPAQQPTGPPRTATPAPPPPAAAPTIAPTPAAAPRPTTPPPAVAPPAIPTAAPPAPTGASVAPADSPMATQRIEVVREQPVDPNRFGQYTLLERIAVGGMAEVWKARMRGLEGFQKTVAIKRILGHMTHNNEFVGMFIDEAKLAAQLSHPNIIHIYDLGKIGADYYIAMEYVEGHDLRSISNLAREKRLPMPQGLAVLVAHQLASALDHAHRKRDFEGHELGLVHRDVSPQNVLISREGDIKLCDFGIAKAVSKASQTQMGALKGKLQYMSPEQAWGRAVDARSDLFSLGTLLFEMLTGERLFSGDSEISVLETVREGKIRSPRDLDPTILPEIDAIVRKALARAPEDRFQSASEMEQRLGAVLYEIKPTPNHTDLAAYLHKLETAPVPVEPLEPRAPIAPPAPVVVSPPPAVAEPAASAPPAAVALPTPEPEPIVEAIPPLGDAPLDTESKKGRGALWGLLAAALLAIAIGAVLYFGRGKAKAPAPQAPAPTAPAQAQPSEALPGAPGTAPVDPTAAAPAATPDLTGMVDQALAKKNEELQKQLDEKERKLKEQLAAAAKSKDDGKAAPPPAPAPTPSVPVAAPVATPEPEPRRTEPEPEPTPAPRVEERRPEPPAPRVEEAPRVREGELVEGGPGVSPPQLVSAPKPEYPALAKRLGVQGIVVVAVLVDENGRVQEARVAEGINQKVGINESALAAARGAKYRPATKQGVRVKMWTRLRIPFKL